jgi:hypothetical protein
MVMRYEDMVVEIIVESMVTMKAKKSPYQSGERDQFDLETLVFDGDGDLFREKLSAFGIVFLYIYMESPTRTRRGVYEAQMSLYHVAARALCHVVQPILALVALPVSPYGSDCFSCTKTSHIFFLEFISFISYMKKKEGRFC